MWSVGELVRQVLAWEVQLLMQVGPPFGAIGDVVDNATICNEFSGAALTRTAL